MEKDKSLGKSTINKLFTITLCNLLIIFIWIHDSHAGSNPLRVGIVGDQTGTYYKNGKPDMEMAYTALKKGVDILSKQNVQLILHIGDIVESSEESDSVYAQNFKKATKTLVESQRPWFLTPGDHDVNPKCYQPGSGDHSRETLFKNLYAERLPQIKEHLYYSFDYGDYHFIALYSHENLHVDPRWGNIFMARISDEQLKWLDNDLKNHRESKGIVVFLHQPLWYNWSGWKKVHDILRRHEVIAVIAGHFHYNQDEGNLDGIKYIIVGPTGGTRNEASSDAIKAWQVTVMDINDKQLNFKLISLDDSKPLHFTPRIDMDRIQAITTMLGYASTKKEIFMENNNLITKCDTNEPATINLALGNPIDLPIEINIKLIGKNLELSSATFVPKFCQTGTNSIKCVIPPGKGVASSNLSDVQLTFNCAVPKPIWTAHPVITGEVRPGDELKLNIRLSFKGQSGWLSVERDFITTIQSCNK
ncbi:MAG: metallophosphoesterase [Candidatus Paceibacterota bacterium]|jgi:hypothetical protein